MSRKFYAVNRHTGERWKPNPRQEKGDNFLIMCDSGFLVEATFIPWNGFILKPLDPKIWKKVMQRETDEE